MKIKGEEIKIQNILDHWKQGKTSLNWRSPNIKEKREWLQACLSWTGLPKQRIPPFNYIIDGNEVTSTLDFYCLLGETFFGYRGYFGQDSYGFNDCFTEILNFEKSKVTTDNGAKVIMKNSEQLRKVLSNEIFSNIVNTFRDQGFNIDLE
jgi:hypothetical protein